MQSQTSTLEEKIEDLFDFIGACKSQRMSSTKIVVSKNDLYDILDDLRDSVPAEIRRCQKMLNQKDDIIAKAKAQAQILIKDGKAQQVALIQENAIVQDARIQADEIIRQAQQQADEILQNAKMQSEEIGNGAIFYTKGLLEMAEKTLSEAYEDTMQRTNSMAEIFQNHLDIIHDNMSELDADANQTETQEEYDVDEAYHDTEEELAYEEEELSEDSSQSN
jgi:hypothetical protein